MSEEIENKITCATEAREVSEANGINYDKILQGINQQCKYGNNCIRFFDTSISNEIIQKLMNAGFLVGKHTGVMGERIIVVSWG